MKNTLHFYTTDNVPSEVWGKEGICIFTVWEEKLNTPIQLWAIPQKLWDTLTNKGIEVPLSFFAGKDKKFEMTYIQPSDW